jgi:DNA-binding NarL/FixJ family response regulator
MPYKILIVDDSKLARMAVTKALNVLHPDWVRLEAASADEALAAVKKEHPDIALVDFNMPGGNGLDLAAAFRESNPRMPVAVVSANRQREIVSRARTIGAAFLNKPLTEEDLDAFLKAAVQSLTKARS